MYKSIFLFGFGLPLGLLGASAPAATAVPSPEAVAATTDKTEPAPAAMVAAPTAPKLTGEASTPSQVDLEWTDGGVGGQADAGFTVQLRTEAAEEWQVVRAAGAEWRRFRVENLRPETNYSFRVWVSNSAGTNCSEVLTVHTPIEAPAEGDVLHVQEVYGPGPDQMPTLWLMPNPESVAQIATLSVRAQWMSGSAVLVPGVVASPSGPDAFILRVGGAPLAALSAVGPMNAGVNFQVLDQFKAVEGTPVACYGAEVRGLAEAAGIAAQESFRRAPYVSEHVWQVFCQGMVGGAQALYLPLVVTGEATKRISIHVEGLAPAQSSDLALVWQEPHITLFSGSNVLAVAPLPALPAAETSPSAPTATTAPEVPPPAPSHAAELEYSLGTGVYTLCVTGQLAEAGRVLIRLATLPPAASANTP